MSEKLSLTQYLCRSGVASRRNSAQIVKSGRVSVDGAIIPEPGFKVPDGANVCVDGKTICVVTQHHYIMLNKPRGYVSSSSDVHAPKKAIDLIKLPGSPRIFSAGRLDKDSRGLLIFSDDGNYVDHLIHPRYRVLKRYLVTLPRELDEKELRRICSGIEDEGEVLRAESIRSCGNRVYEVVLNEGKKREIRRLTAAVGAPTLDLQRVSIGALALGDLPEGQFRELSEEEIKLSLTPDK